MRSVAICICTRDRPLELTDTLASIALATIRPSQVIVSDDGCDPRTRAVCAAAELGVVYTAGPQRGLAANRNHALSHVDAAAVLFLDDDCLLRPGFLSVALACMSSHEKVHGAGRVIVTGVETNNGRIVHAAAQSFLGFQQCPYGPGERLTSIVINATVFPRGLFDTLQFDDQIRYGYEEVDLASRAVASGYEIIECVEAVNDHHPSPRGRTDYSRAMVASRLFVTLKRYALTERRPGRAAAFALIAPIHVIAAALRNNGLQGLKPALAALYVAARYFVAQAPGRGGRLANLRRWISRERRYVTLGARTAAAAADWRSSVQLWVFGATILIKQRLGLDRRSVRMTVVLKERPFRVCLRGRTDLEVLHEIAIEDEYALSDLVDAQVIVDLGAHVGFASLRLLAAHPEATVLAVEADPYLLSQLEENVRGLPVTVVHAAVSGKTGERLLYRSTNSSWGNSLRRTLPWQEPVVVSSTSLDDLLDTAGLEYVDLLKMDIEGAEWEVLGESIPDRVGTLVGEFHAVAGRPPDELLARLGATMAIDVVRADADRLVFVATRKQAPAERTPRSHDDPPPLEM